MSKPPVGNRARQVPQPWRRFKGILLLALFACLCGQLRAEVTGIADSSEVAPEQGQALGNVNKTLGEIERLRAGLENGNKIALLQRRLSALDAGRSHSGSRWKVLTEG